MIEQEEGDANVQVSASGRPQSRMVPPSRSRYRTMLTSVLFLLLLASDNLFEDWNARDECLKISPHPGQKDD